MYTAHLTKSVALTDESRFLNFSAVAVLGILSWWDTVVPTQSLFTQMLRGSRISQFIYCTKSEEREGFSMFFWTVPFDNWSWIMIAISAISVAVSLDIKPFEILAILLRQESQVFKGKQKLVIIFVFSSFIFSYGYEGVISSFLTVKPPVKIYDRLKDVLAQNYSILHPASSGRRLFQEVFKTENISTSIESTVSTIKRNSVDRYLLAPGRLANCNVTMPVKFGFGEYIKIKMKIRFPEVSCNIMKKSTTSYTEVYLFFGSEHSILARITELMRQSGLLFYYIAFEDYVGHLSKKRDLLLMEANETMTEPFNMKDLKILSVFLGWTSLLGVAVVGFTAEILFESRRSLIHGILLIRHKLSISYYILATQILKGVRRREWNLVEYLLLL